MENNEANAMTTPWPDVIRVGSERYLKLLRMEQGYAALLQDVNEKQDQLEDLRDAAAEVCPNCRKVEGDARKMGTELCVALAENAKLVEVLREYLDRDDRARRNAAPGSQTARVLGSVFGGALPEKARATLRIK